MMIQKEGNAYSIEIGDETLRLKSADATPLRVRQLPDGGLQIVYNAIVLNIKDGRITDPDGRMLDMVMPKVRKPQTDFADGWENSINNEIVGLWRKMAEHMGLFIDHDAELKELRRLWEQNEKMNVDNAARLDKLEKDANSLITPVHSAEVSQFSASGTVTLRLCMAGEEIESFLAGHAVDFKRVPGGLNLILTPRRIWQVATRWADYCRERAALSVDESVVQTLGGSHQVRPAKEPEKGEDGKYGDRAMGEFLTFGEKYWILLKGEYGDVVKAIYNGDGEFLCKGLSVKASPRFKPQKA